MRTASTGHRARGKQQPEQQPGAPRRQRRGVNGPLLAWAMIMALALLSSAAHLWHEDGLALHRVGAATHGPGGDTPCPTTA